MTLNKIGYILNLNWKADNLTLYLVELQTGLILIGLLKAYLKSTDCQGLVKY